MLDFWSELFKKMENISLLEHSTLRNTDNLTKYSLKIFNNRNCSAASKQRFLNENEIDKNSTIYSFNYFY